MLVGVGVGVGVAVGVGLGLGAFVGDIVGFGVIREAGVVLELPPLHALMRDATATITIACARPKNE